MSLPVIPGPYPKMEQPAHRPKEMQVLGLGLSRTGTMSLYTGLHMLGYNCYHAREYGMDNANKSLLNWDQAIDAKFNGKGKKFEGKDFDKMLWRYEAVTDIPCILFAEELMDAYPDAKIVLSTRDVDGWIASVNRSFYAILVWKRWSFLELVDWEFINPYIRLLKTALNIWTGGNWRDKTQLPTGFDRHHEHVRKLAAARGRKVLEFRAKDGWEPLCKFLGKEVPEEKYPHVNEGDWVADQHYVLFWYRFMAVGAKALKVGVPVVVGVIAWWIFVGSK